MAAITEYPTAPMVLGIGALAVAKAPDWGKRLMWFAAGLTLPLLVGGIYHQLAFGSPWTTGYGFIANPAFHKSHETGIFGVGLPSGEALWAISFGLQRGLFALAPWLLCALAGLFGALRGPQKAPHQLLRAILLAHLLLTVWVASGFSFWLGGWSVGPRHLVSALPAAAILSLLGWGRLRDQGGLLAECFDLGVRGLLAASVVACTAVALTFPGFPEEIQAPLFELTLPMLARLQGGESVGTALGLPSNLALIPPLLLAAWLLAEALAGGARNLLEARGIFRVGTAAWVALGFFVCAAAMRPAPRPESLFRQAWLTQTVWQPRDVRHGWDPRPAHWDRARRAERQGRASLEDHDALGAVHSHRREDHKALREYTLGAPVAR